ncbi:MAG: isopentenyl-diphosphate Delta-isomerase [Clostridiales bacterium]
MDEIILVDVYDRVCGSAEKLAAHRQPLLHRAFSVFLYHGEQVLIQKRALAKYHSGGLWANSCCSHPRVGESVLTAAGRRLPEELGCRAVVEDIASFVYFHRFDDAMFEYEYDHILVGEYNGSLQPNPDEVAELKWVDQQALAADLLLHPQQYSVWFQIAAPMVLRWLAQK